MECELSYQDAVDPGLLRSFVTTSLLEVLAQTSTKLQHPAIEKYALWAVFDREAEDTPSRVSCTNMHWAYVRGASVYDLCSMMSHEYTHNACYDSLQSIALAENESLSSDD